MDSRFAEEFEREDAGGAVAEREALASSSSLPINGFLSDSGVSTRGGVLGGVGVLGAGECVFMGGGGLGGCLKELDESRDDATVEPAIDVGWADTDLGTDGVLLLLLKTESIDIREEGNVDDNELVVWKVGLAPTAGLGLGRGVSGLGAPWPESDICDWKRARKLPKSGWLLSIPSASSSVSLRGGPGEETERGLLLLLLLLLL